MKKFIIVSFLLTSLFTATAQHNMDEPYLFWSGVQPVIVVVNLRTGETVNSPALRENPVLVVFNKGQNKIYVATKHFGYQLDAKTCEILIEFQFADILQKKSDNSLDPNLHIYPVDITDEGAVFYFDYEKNLDIFENHHRMLKKCDIVNKKITDFTVIESDKIRIKSIRKNYLIFEHKFATGDNIFILDKVSSDKYYITETLSIPIQLANNEFELKLENINSLTLQKIENNIVTLRIMTSDIKTFLYSFNVKEQKLISLKEYRMANNKNYSYNCGIDSKNTYIAVRKKAKKPPMPTRPEMYIPEKFNKKTEAEADRINAEREKEYDKQYAKWEASLINFYGDITELYIVDNGEKKLLKSFPGATSIKVYEDRYVYYANSLEYGIYDLEKDTILWSNLN